MAAGANRSFNILMIVPSSFFGDYGGHIRILEETHALQQVGHRVTIVTYYMGRDVPGVTIERTSPLPWHADYEVGSSRHKIAFDLYLAAKAFSVALRLRPDIIHGHMHEGALIGGVLARLLRVPLVFDFQGSMTGEMVDHGFIKPGGRPYRALFWLERLISARLPQAVLTSSVRARGLLVEKFGVPADRIHPLPDCANLDHFDSALFTSGQKQALRRQWAIPPERPIVAYLGLLADYQGTDQLLQAAAWLKEAGREVHFLIMGYPNVEHYQAMARELGVAGLVTFTGRVDYERDAPRLLALGDVAVSPKLSATEGSGKVLNYMAMGQPVVAFDTDVHREYLGEWGVYVPAGDVPALAQAVAGLLADEPRRRCLGQELRQRAAQQYSWAAACRQIVAIYQSLTSESAAAIM